MATNGSEGSLNEVDKPNEEFAEKPEFPWSTVTSEEVVMGCDVVEVVERLIA